MNVAEIQVEPFGSVSSRRPTIPPPTTDPLTQEAVILRSLDTANRVAEVALKSGKAGPWLVSLVVSLVTSGVLWGAHMVTGDRAILDRLDALERAHDDRMEHDQWMVGAIQALHAGQALPPVPPPPRRRLARDER